MFLQAGPRSVWRTLYAHGVHRLAVHAHVMHSHVMHAQTLHARHAQYAYQLPLLQHYQFHGD
jgi:hypothetical protein